MIELHVRPNMMLVADVLHVLKDLLGSCVVVGPVGIRLEGVRIVMRRDVTLTSRVSTRMSKDSPKLCQGLTYSQATYLLNLHYAHR